MHHLFWHTYRKKWAAVLLLPLLFSCQKEVVSEIPEPEILVIPAGFPEMSFPEDNTFSRARWELGKKLFFDPILSEDNSISCGSCHKPSLAFADDKDFSPGVENQAGVRNAPSLANVGYHPYFLREGSVPTLEMQVLVPIQEENEFAHDILAISELLQKDEDYVKMSQEAYGRAPDPFVLTRALGVFQRTLISGSSAFDHYFYQGKTATLSESQRRGMDLFFGEKTNCGKCHGGFNFTDYSFQNNGLDSVYKDNGRQRFTGKREDEATFKVPSLRNVELTAPYMHDGRFETITEVVEHYNSGGKAHPNRSPLLKELHLTSNEKADLVAFLKSLTDWDFVNNPNFREH